MRQPLACLLLLIALPAAAQIYKYTDAHGNPVFTSQPPDNVRSEIVELPPLNSVELQQPAPAAPRMPQNIQPSDSPAAYSLIELTDLPTAEALRANNGTFTVGVHLEPRLQSPHRLRLVLDGNPYGQPSNIPLLQLVNIDRGEHTLSVQVLQGDQILQQSPSVTLTVQRVHKR